jgi:hypothetical protein
MLLLKAKLIALAFVIVALVALGGEVRAFDGQKVLEAEVIAGF